MKPLYCLTAALALLTSVATAETSTGDCDGWAITSTARLESGSFYAIAHATLFELVGSDWVALETSIDDGWMSVTVTDYSNGASILDLGSSWSGELPQGTYRVEVDLMRWDSRVNGSWQSIEDARNGGGFLYNLTRYIDAFYCDGPPPPLVSARTPGYWKNHAAMWPLLVLELGDELLLFDQHCLLEQLSLPTRGDVRIKLVHHLIAAKLNLANGADPGAITGFPAVASTIVDTIAAADAYLISSEIGCSGIGGSKPRGGERALVVDLKDALDAYNNNFEEM